MARHTVISNVIRIRPMSNESTEHPISVIGEKQFKIPLLFPPPNTKGLDEPRTFVYGVTTDTNGTEIERSVQVLGNNVTSGYTSDTLGVIATINEMWREQGSPEDGKVFGTYADLARRIGRTDVANESYHRRHVAAELHRLRRCILVFSQYYTKNALRENQEITYFSELKYVTDKKNPSNNYWEATIAPYVLDNLREGYIASLPLAALLSIKNDNSKPILLKVDSILAGKEKCELNCDSVFTLASITVTDWYKKPSVRRKMLTQIQQDLDGKVISSGWKISVTVMSTVGEKDIKLVFQRVERVTQTERRVMSKPIAVLNSDPILIQMLVNDITAIIGQSKENESLYFLYARSYPDELIHRAISMFKADKPADLKSPGAFFSSILAKLVREHGFNWIKD